jgi:hypothetical protein
VSGVLALANEGRETGHEGRDAHPLPFKTRRPNAKVGPSILFKNDEGTLSSASVSCPLRLAASRR